MLFAKGGGGEHRFNGARTLKVGLCGNGPAHKTSSSKCKISSTAAKQPMSAPMAEAHQPLGGALPGTRAGAACPHDGGHDQPRHSDRMDQ
jgi:hypothetical protein